MLDVSMLPAPSQFYAAELGNLRRPSRGWTQVRCVFHEERTPSLSINLQNGGFFCHGCGAKGGDVVDFLKLRDGLSFKQACEQLNCWKGHVSRAERSEMEKIRREKARIKSAAERLTAEEKRLRIDACTRLHNLENMQQEISQQLAELEQAPGADAEKDRSWELLSMLEEEIRSAEAEYRLLSFASAPERAKFVLDEDSRPEMLDSFLLSAVMP